MSEIRTFFDAARPYGAKDPAMTLREGEGVVWGSAFKRIGPTTLLLEVGAHIPTGETLPFRFLVSERNFYRKSGPSKLLRTGHYRVLRTEALSRAIEKVSLFRKFLPPATRIDYNEFPVQSARVEDVRVGPLADPESLAVFVELLTGDGRKIVAFGKGVKIKGPGKVGLEIVASDTNAALDPELDASLRVIATRELRRLGVSL